jgi:nucleotide-binding universal stress UspA family protein
MLVTAASDEHHSFAPRVRNNNDSEGVQIMRATARTRIALKNVLFATDLSDASCAAIPYAKQIAKRYGAHLFVLHVRPPVVNPMTPPQTWGNAEEVTKNENEKCRQELTRVFTESHADILIQEGDLESILASTIKQNNIDLLVIGTRGRSGIKKFLLGSVAEEIFRQASCPVLIVGPDAPMRLAPDGPPRRILYATDLSPDSHLVASYAVSLAQEFQASLTVVYVRANGRAGDLVTVTALENHYRDLLHGLVPHEAETWCKVDHVVEKGEVADTILEVAKKRNVDLIVMGVHAQKGFPGAATHLPITTAHKVVSHAHSPVFTVRH